ncbi:MAG: cytochrome c biogenesis protein CcdA [Acidimicrobiia bacterium]
MSAVLAAAFAAGMVSTVNPCGFAMLPAYLGLFIGDGPDLRRPVLAVAGAVSAGFVVVFVVAGAFVTLGVRAIITWIPWIALVIGIGFVVLGIAMVAGRDLLPALRPGGRGTKDRTFAGMFTFGASYGVASLACTLPIFLSLTAGAIAGGSVGEGLITFAAYGLGMALSVTVITVAIGLGRDRIVERIRPLAARLHIIAGVTLIGAGGLIAWHWATVLSSGAVALTGSPLVRWIERTAASVAGIVAAQPMVAGLVAIAIVALGVGLAADNGAPPLPHNPSQRKSHKE